MATTQRYKAPADVLTALEQAITDGLPRPDRLYARDDLAVPFIHLAFGINDTADVDKWAAMVGATVGFVAETNGDYLDDDCNPVGVPWHEYGTGYDHSVYGQWLDRRVLLTCEVLGPHTLSQPAAEVKP